MITALAIFACKSAAVLCAAAVAALLCRRLGAAYRHLILTAGFAAVLLLPVLQALLPARPIAVLPPAAKPPVEAPLETPSVAGPATQDLGPAEATSPALPPAPTPPSWPRWVPILWAAGAAVVLVEHLLSLALLARTSCKAIRLDTARSEGLARRAGVRRSWILLRDLPSASSGPRTWGVIRPVVAIPENSLAWPEERLEAVLLHELIHVRRLDSLAQTIATLACAANWFNPLVWICAKQARKEAEQAADDAVLTAGIRPSVYAEALLQVALDFRSSARFFSPGVPLMKQSRIEARIDSILSARPRSRAINRIGFASTAVAALALVAPCAAFTFKRAQAQAQQPWVVRVRPEGTTPAQPAPNHAPHAKATGASRTEDELRREVDRLQSELEIERMQLSNVQRELSEIRKREGIHRNPAILIEQGRLHAQADMQHAQAQIRVQQANVAAQNAQVDAAKAQLGELRRRQAIGLADNQVLIQAQANMATRLADRQAAIAALAAAQTRTYTLRYRREATRQSVAAAQAQLDAAQADLQLKRKLYSQGAVRKAEIDKATALVAILKARLLQLKAQVDFGGK